MIDIKHKRQRNDGINWKCGAVCLEMIYDYFQIEYDSDKIWDNVKTRRNYHSLQMYSLTYKLAQDAICRGLPATIYKGKNAHILEKVDQLQTPAILSLKQAKSGESHFVVFQGIKNQNYYFRDPDAEKSVMTYLDLQNLWSPDPKINITGFIFIMFNNRADRFFACEHCNNKVPIVHDTLEEKVQSIICPYCDCAI